jgi:hypothetical protein
MTTSRKDLGVFARELLRDPRLFNKFLAAVEGAGLIGEAKNALALYVGATSRLLVEPVNVVIRGPSAAGKNWVATRVLSYIPRSEVVKLTSASARSWNYAKDEFVNKIVYLAERNDASGMVEPMRLFISEGRLEHRVTEWVERRRVTVTHIANGPVACISTTNRSLEIDDATRHVSVWVDPSAEQTRRIVMAYHRGSRRPPEAQFKTWKRLQRILTVRADRLGNGDGIAFPSWWDVVAKWVFVSDVSVRRYYPAFVEACRAVCLIRSFQDGRREADERLTINFADYVITAVVFESVFVESLQRQDGSALQIADTIRKISGDCGDEPVQAKDLAAELQIPMGQAYKRLREAVASGAVKRVNQPEKGNRKVYLPVPRSRFVPSPNVVFAEAKIPKEVRVVHPLTGEVLSFERKR